MKEVRTIVKKEIQNEISWKTVALIFNPLSLPVICYNTSHSDGAILRSSLHQKGKRIILLLIVLICHEHLLLLTFHYKFLEVTMSYLSLYYKKWTYFLAHSKHLINVVLKRIQKHMIPQKINGQVIRQSTCLGIIEHLLIFISSISYQQAVWQ